MSVFPDRMRLRGSRATALAVAVLALGFAAGGCTGSGDEEDASDEAIKRVGLMHVGTDHIPPALEPLKARLAELGWTEGENIELTFANLEPEDAPAQARVFVLDGVDAIVAFEDQSIDAAAEGDRRRWDPGRLPPSLRPAP